MIMMQNNNQEPSALLEALSKDLKGMKFFAPSKSILRAKFQIRHTSKLKNMFFAPSKSFLRAKIQIRRLSKLEDYIQIIIKMQNSNQEPQVYFIAPRYDLRDREILFN